MLIKLYIVIKMKNCYKFCEYQNILLFINLISFSRKNDNLSSILIIDLKCIKDKSTCHLHYFDKIQEKDLIFQRSPSCPIYLHKIALEQHPTNKINIKAQNLGYK